MSDATCLEVENWRDVAGYEGVYQVSDGGHVRSLDHWVPCGRYPGGSRLARGQVLRPDVNRQGYLRVRLAGRAVSVHSLVAETFIGPRPDGLQVCHNDGDKNNNTPSNLRYDTASANVRDCVRHGTQAQARKVECPSGHRYDEANTMWVRTKSGRGRQCLTCHRDRERARRAAANRNL